MGGLIEKLLYPKRIGLIGRNKPQLIILGSPNDPPNNAAVKYSGTKTFVENYGYNVLNKEVLLFGESEISLKKIRPITTKSREVTVWLEAHGAPGWLFSSKATRVYELEETLKFALYISDLEKKLGVQVTNIVLNACNSATEACNLKLEEPTYFVSPARVLSILFPGINVAAFVGTNSSAVITNLFQLKGTVYEPVYLGLHDAAILFNSGKVLEKGEAFQQPLFCERTKACTPLFVLEECRFDEDQLLQIGLALETINEVRAVRGSSNKNSLGDWQIEQALNYALSLQKTVQEAEGNQKSAEKDYVKTESKTLKINNSEASVTSLSEGSCDWVASSSSSEKKAKFSCSMFSPGALSSDNTGIELDELANSASPTL